MEQLSKNAKTGAMFLNPLIKQLDKLKESSDTCATYVGIFKKCLFFIAMIVAGVALQMILNAVQPIVVDGAGEIEFPPITAILAIVSAVVMLIFPFVAFIVRRTIPFTGAAYCLFLGFVLSLFGAMDPEIGGIVLLALALTLTIVVVMAVLFTKGKITVTKKFRAITTTLFFTMVFGGLVVFLLSLIPALKEPMMYLQNNLALSVLFSLLGIVVATLFLLVDFDRIKRTVDEQLPKKHEWYAAFSMVFTVIWLYFKVLDLLTQLKDAK